MSSVRYNVSGKRLSDMEPPFSPVCFDGGAEGGWAVVGRAIAQQRHLLKRVVEVVVG